MALKMLQIIYALLNPIYWRMREKRRSECDFQEREREREREREKDILRSVLENARLSLSTMTKHLAINSVYIILPSFSVGFPLF